LFCETKIFHMAIKRIGYPGPEVNLYCGRS